MQSTNTSSLSLPGLNPSNHAAAGSTSLGTTAAVTGESIRKRNKNDEIEKNETINSGIKRVQRVFSFTSASNS